MKPVLLSILCLLTANAFASQTPEQAKERYERASEAREQSMWSCNNPYSRYTDALSVFHTGRSQTPEFNHTVVMTIRDPAICRALGVTAPFTGLAREGSFHVEGATLSGIWATVGMDEDTVFFGSDAGGMKAIRINNGSRANVDANKGFYFNPGLCQSRVH